MQGTAQELKAVLAYAEQQPWALSADFARAQGITNTRAARLYALTIKERNAMRYNQTRDMLAGAGWSISGCAREYDMPRETVRHRVYALPVLRMEYDSMQEHKSKALSILRRAKRRRDMGF